MPIPAFVSVLRRVGNLPRVHNMDIQYAQSGVFTPCDFAFPTDGKRAEATPNTEMILVSDVDLDLLSALHTYGSVRNLKDRRNDVYEVKMEDGKEVLLPAIRECIKNVDLQKGEITVHVMKGLLDE